MLIRSVGAYLVEGLGHCGACHTPRGIGFQEQSLHDSDDGRYLSGSAVEGWFAKNLRNEGLGLATWSEAEIVEFLRTGRTDRVAVFGAMADVVAHSSRYMSVDDLSAIAAYLKQLAPQPGGRGAWQRGEDLTTAALRSGTDTSPGALLYVEQCSLCHRLDGQGAPRIFPSLAGNSIVFAEDARSLIQVTLAGDRMPLTDADRMAFAMPAFDHLSDGELAQVLSYVRAGWGNNAGPVSEWDIRRMRAELAHKPTHHVPEVTP
ncbi:c-type cytochrome [Isoalcanivorax beigongshangi]|uniref:Cytochrome c n=1 Tax=Isoalcanivorax beigongshangi TaxID=3238810 RepID=A0ABV4AFW2_9GAMM